MGSLAVDEKDYQRAQKMLDQVDSLQPDDLWAFVDHLRIEADLIPTRRTFERARAILLDSHFPEGVRQTVYHDARYMQGLTDGERDTFSRVPCKAGIESRRTSLPPSAWLSRHPTRSW